MIAIEQENSYAEPVRLLLLAGFLFPRKDDMEKNEYEEAVFKSGLSREAKLVLLAYLHHCKQQELKEVWPSQSRIADYAGMTRDTVKTYVTLLVEAGWLIEAKKHEGNVQGYTFAVADTFDNRLAKKKRKSAPASLKQLRKGSATDTSSVAESNGAVAERTTEQLPNGAGSVAETGSAGKEEKNNLEKKEKNSAVPAPNLPGDDHPSLGSSTEAVAPPIEKELRKSKDYDLALSLFLDREFKPGREDDKRAMLACWEADNQYDERVKQEYLEASEKIQVGKGTNKASEAGRENPRPVDDPMTSEDVEAEW